MGDDDLHMHNSTAYMHNMYMHSSGEKWKSSSIHPQKTDINLPIEQIHKLSCMYALLTNQSTKFSTIQVVPSCLFLRFNPEPGRSL